MGKIIFWGAGKIGRDILKFWKYHNIYPDFFCDSSSNLWDKEIDNIKILSPSQV